MTGLLKLMVVCELYFSCVGLLAVLVSDVWDQLGAGVAKGEIYGERERGSRDSPVGDTEGEVLRCQLIGT